MHFADAEGTKKVYDTIVEYQAKYGDHWQPAPLLEQLANEGPGSLGGWGISNTQFLVLSFEFLVSPSHPWTSRGRGFSCPSRGLHSQFLVLEF
jgi:hypothetical protein